MTETRVSYHNVYRGSDHRNTVHAIKKAVAAFNERYPENPERIRADVNEDGDYEVGVHGSGNY